MSKTDEQIAQQANLLPIEKIAERLGVPASALEAYGKRVAKVNPWEVAASKKDVKQGNLILVTALSPTPAGEGKTVTSIGLNDALCELGYQSVLCLREPSLGPYFGMKGGATGGGYAQVGPSEPINLHFTGDFHAITSAHNLLAAMIDNHLYWGNEQRINPFKIYWKRVQDMNDRSLRQIVTGVNQNIVKESSFEITAASEIMAIVALSKDWQDLKQRLDRIVVAQRYDGSYVYARDFEITNALLKLLKEAIKPNLIQSLENNPVLMHAGPFANIAHGCNSVIATKLGLQLGDYVVTEAGFGADLGAEKFFDIKSRQAELQPKAVTCVATVRALKMHGGVSKADLEKPNVAAVEAGLANLGRHIENIQQYQCPVVVAINHMTSDHPDEIACIQTYCEAMGVKAITAQHWAKGGVGATDLAKALVQAIETNQQSFKLLYDDSLPLVEKITTIAQKIYRADGIHLSKKAKQQLETLQKNGFGHLPICMAKTQYSFSADPAQIGAPTGYHLPIRDITFSNGAGFIVVLCGDIMTMPGLSRHPAACDM